MAKGGELGELRVGLGRSQCEDGNGAVCEDVVLEALATILDGGKRGTLKVFEVRLGWLLGTRVK